MRDGSHEQRAWLPKTKGPGSRLAVSCASDPDFALSSPRDVCVVYGDYEEEEVEYEEEASDFEFPQEGESPACIPCSAVWTCRFYKL